MVTRAEISTLPEMWGVPFVSWFPIFIVELSVGAWAAYRFFGVIPFRAPVLARRIHRYRRERWPIVGNDLEGDRVVREIELELGMARPDVVKRLGPLQTVLPA